MVTPMEVDAEERSFIGLPVDILLQVVEKLPRHDVFFGIGQVNGGLRKLAHQKVRRKKLFDAHCLVHITDSVVGSPYRSDGTDPMVTYTFTIFDSLLPDYEQKRRTCLRGNDQRYRELHISHNHDSKMTAELDSPGFNLNISPTSAHQMLKFMNICAMRFIVNKQCRAESLRKEDDYFLDCINFCERKCGKVDLKALLLTSKSVLFPWKMAPASLEKLSTPGLRSLILENMLTLDAATLADVVPMGSLESLQFRLDVRHRMEIENLSFSGIDGKVLRSLSKASVQYLDFSAYSDVSSMISSITPLMICQFISEWKASKKPWLIRNLAFNSTFTIDEFRMAAYSKFTNRELEDAPYCRFQAQHKNYPNVILQLTCYANGNATQWSLRTGHYYTASN